ncbi:MAG: hypothetical protein ACI9TF_000006 [Paracrocinitomix sp.]|jgi:hypothetical protein
MSIDRIYTRWPSVEGYCDQQSYAAGELVAVCCADRSGGFRATVTRVGGERKVLWTSGPLEAADHPVPDDAWSMGCDWPAAFTIRTEASWQSGFYEIEFQSDEPGPRSLSHAFFVVRARTGEPSNRTLLVLATNTYNAYNQWGGRCMYSGAPQLSFARPTERGFHARPAAPFDVDFDGRLTNTEDPSDPEHQRLVDYQIANDLPMLTGSSGWHNWERRFVRWAEQAGFGFDMAANIDLDVRPEILDHYDVLLSVGHDEYWSSGMRDTVDAWVQSGGRWAIFSGNTAFWQVRYEDDGRTMVCHKGAARFTDPVRDNKPHLLTSMWSDPLIGRPETSTTGLTFTQGGYHRIGGALPNGTGDYEVHQPDHWVFAGTGLSEGERLGTGSFIVGYEVDGCALQEVAGRPVPTHEDGAPESLEVLATAPARLISITDDVCEAPVALWASVDPPGDLEGVAMTLFGDTSPENVAKIANGHAVMGYFTRGKGNVFNAGSVDWSYGLDTDEVVQQVTANVLRHFGV